MLFGCPPGLDRSTVLEHPKRGAIHSCTVAGEPAYFAMQLVPIQCAAKDISHVLPSVPSLNLLEDQLFRLQLPSARGIHRGIYVMSRE